MKRNAKRRTGEIKEELNASWNEHKTGI